MKSFAISLLMVALVLAIVSPTVAGDKTSPSPPSMVLDGTVDVSTLPIPTAAKLSATRLQMRVPDAALLHQVKLGMARKAFGAAGAVPLAGVTPEALTASTVTVGTSFQGLNFLETGLGIFGFVPPDTQIAAGPNNLMEAANAGAGIYDKAGHLLLLFSLYDFFRATFGSQIVSDPWAVYDAASGRWFLSVVVVNGTLTSGGWRLAVSTSSDPTGSYYLYTINTKASFPDFPKLGICDNKVVLTGDAFNNNTFKGTEFVVANKAQAIAGVSPVATKFFGPNQGMFAIEPAVSLSSTTTEYMVAVGADPVLPSTSVRLWSITGVPGVGKGVSATHADLGISPLNTPPNAAQAGTTNLVDTNGDWLLNAVSRNGSLWTSAIDACTPSGDGTVRSCLRYIKINTGTKTNVQDFDLGTAGVYYYYPALETDGSGNLVTVFNGSTTDGASTIKYPSVLASQQLTTDPLNTLETPVLIHAGDVAYTQSNRFGDYSGAGADPDGSVWIASEYATSLVGSAWSTWIADVP